MVEWVLSAVTEGGVADPLLVLGHEAELVAEGLPGVDWILQEPQNGTGHAVAVALDHLGTPDAGSTMIVSYGDMPLVPADVYRTLADRAPDVAAIMTTVDPGPPGFGRVLRDAAGAVV